jgi:hypothetical protein
MLYKTIVLELLQARPEVHEKLRRQRMLLKAMEFYASELKDLHEAYKLDLAEMKPDIDESQIASQALEMALKELEGILPSDTSTEEADQPSLDDFMTYLRDRTPPA